MIFIVKDFLILLGHRSMCVCGGGVGENPESLLLTLHVHCSPFCKKLN